MYKEGHWGVSLLMYSPVVIFLMLIDPIIDFSTVILALYGLGIVSFTASFPDVDMKLKNFTPIKHRGITHTVWFALFMGSVAAVVTYGLYYYFLMIGATQISLIPPPIVAVTFALFMATYGTISHLMGDVITPTGLRPFRPVKNTRYVRVLEFNGEKSKAANEHWNNKFYILGTIVCALSFGTHPYIIEFIIVTIL